MQPFQYFILRFFLKALYIVPLVPLVMLMQYCEAHEALTRFVWIIAVLGCIYLAAAFYLAHKTAQHMAFEEQTFSLAVRSTFYDIRLYLAFLPLIGHWFASGGNHRQDDDDDDSA
jgi:hypothetical protein